MDLPKSYDPSTTEGQIYKMWLESGYFDPDKLPPQQAQDGSRGTATRKPYTIILPPLNVTGTLHMGHAFEDSIQDILIRFKRMQGYKTLWLPGTDHAAIATQSKVEKMIKDKEKLSRHDLGREVFLDRVKAFAQESHDTIVNQLKVMGASVDWSREAYTLDETRNRAVKLAFKRFYDLGLIYRGLRIVNWDPKGQTTISDDEIVREERPGKLYTFKYSKDFPIAISTTRPETKVGDTAVAVHPGDERYKEFVGKEYDVNFAGEALHIKIVADESVDPEFGTGALGVTPAHSLVDWDIAEKNNLPHKQVIDEFAKMTVGPEEIKGKKIAEAREYIVSWLKEQGLLEKEEDITQNFALAERTKGVIEPLPKEQWFMDVDKEFKLPHSEIAGIEAGETVTLKRLMRHVVETGQVNITPKHFEKIYFHWIDNLRDWCVSRQIWFGHRIPVWYDKEGNKFTPIEKQLYLARHAECEDNTKNIAARPDSALTTTGLDQAKVLADQMRSKNITTILCSPLLRSKHTAELVAEELGMDKSSILVVEELSEIHVGDILGQVITPDTHGFVEAQAKGTGESTENLDTRIHVLLEKLENLETEGNILAIGHGGINALIEAVLQGRKKESFVQFRLTRGEIKNGSWQKITLVQDPKGEGLTQDEDTFDTWFSSGLWTFTTLGWPQETQDLKTFHPTSVINPGYEILQLWVARMILMSTTLTGQAPFHEAFIHGLVRDKQGRKFSKSLNNGVDPLEMTEKYGTDALRMALVFTAAPGGDVAFDEQRIKGMKHFANKLWNISRFVITNLENSKLESLNTKQSQNSKSENNSGLETNNSQHSHLWGRPETPTQADADILNKIDVTIEEVTKHLEAFRLHEAAQSIYQFTWHELADVYLEASKEQLQDEKLKVNTQKVLLHCLTTVLKLLHPFMPFITEHIAGLMTEKGLHMHKDPLIVSAWPKVE